MFRLLYTILFTACLLGLLIPLWSKYDLPAPGVITRQDPVVAAATTPLPLCGGNYMHSPAQNQPHGWDNIVTYVAPDDHPCDIFFYANLATDSPMEFMSTADNRPVIGVVTGSAGNCNFVDGDHHRYIYCIYRNMQNASAAFSLNFIRDEDFPEETKLVWGISDNKELQIPHVETIR